MNNLITMMLLILLPGIYSFSADSMVSQYSSLILAIAYGICFIKVLFSQRLRISVNDRQTFWLIMLAVCYFSALWIDSGSIGPLNIIIHLIGFGLLIIAFPPRLINNSKFLLQLLLLEVSLITLELMTLNTLDVKANLAAKTILPIIFYLNFRFRDNRNNFFLIIINFFFLFAMYELASKITLVLMAVLTFLSMLPSIGRYFYSPSAIIFVSLTSAMLYVVMVGLSQAGQINLISQSLGAGNFFSGREVLWPGLFFDFLNSCNLFIGCDLTETAFIFRDSLLSAHNSFLQLLRQAGIIGLVLSVLLIRNVCALPQKYLPLEYHFFTLSFVMLLNTETMLFQSKPIIAVLFILVYLDRRAHLMYGSAK